MNATTPKRGKGRPRVPEKMRLVTVWATLPAAIVEQVDKMAEARFQSRNECLRGIILDHFIAKGATPNPQEILACSMPPNAATIRESKNVLDSTANMSEKPIDRQDYASNSELLNIAMTTSPIHENRLLRRREVEALTGKRARSIYYGMRHGTFPLPVKIGPRSVAWRSRDIEAFLEHGAVWQKALDHDNE